MVNFSFEIEDKLLKDFIKMAELNGDDPSSLVLEFIKKYIEDHKEILK